MQVTDKMVEAACDTWIDAHASGKAQSLPEGLRLALTAALAHREAEAGKNDSHNESNGVE